MNLVPGDWIRVLQASDPNQVGLEGTLLLETCKTILMECSGRRVKIQKSRTLVRVEASGDLIRGDEILGRIEERMARTL